MRMWTSWTSWTTCTYEMMPMFLNSNYRRNNNRSRLSVARQLQHVPITLKPRKCSLKIVNALFAMFLLIVVIAGITIALSALFKPGLDTTEVTPSNSSSTTHPTFTTPSPQTEQHPQTTVNRTESNCTTTTASMCRIFNILSDTSSTVEQWKLIVLFNKLYNAQYHSISSQ